MEGYKSFREAVESVSSAADAWLDLSTGNWFDIEEYLNRKMKLQAGDEYEVIGI